MDKSNYNNKNYINNQNNSNSPRTLNGTHSSNNQQTPQSSHVLQTQVSPSQQNTNDQYILNSSNFNELGNQENRRFLGIRLPRISTMKWFNKKPRLESEPEVIELGPPREHEDISTASRHIDGQDQQGVTDEQNSLVFDTHIAVLYDRYLNFKERISNKIRNRIMAFMQDDLDNRANQDDMDIEGGYSDVPTDSTYDGLVLILTIVLGFILRLPSMWVVGCMLFLMYGNYKKKILKWGFINSALAVISLFYVIHMWNYSDPDLFSIKLPLRSVLLSKTHYIKGEEGTLKYQGKDALLVTIEGNKDLKWTLIHKDTQHNLKHGNFSDNLLINSKLIPKGADMIRLNNEFVIKGLILISAKFKTNHLTPKQTYEKPKSHHYPLHHKPSENPFDLSFECYPIESNEIRVVDEKDLDKSKLGTENREVGDNKEIDNNEDNSQDVNDEHLPVKVNNDSNNDVISKLDVDDNNMDNLFNRDDEENNENKDNKEDKIDNKDSENMDNTENKEDKQDKKKDEVEKKDNGNDKMYIGIDAIVSDENVTRIFNLRKLCKCSLVYVPKKDMDIITASIKRID